jgi:hypothetical protein
MAIFKKTTSVWENDHRTINIHNMNISATHLGNEQEIISFFDKIALLSHTKDYNDTQIASMIHDYIKYSPRIIKTLFYKHKKDIIALIFSDIAGIKQSEDFSQEITMRCCKNNFGFSIVELPISKYSDIQKGALNVPEDWKPFEQLNKTFNKMSIFFT